MIGSRSIRMMGSVGFFVLSQTKAETANSGHPEKKGVHRHLPTHNLFLANTNCT